MSKYKNVPTVIDGIRFDSKKEAARYQELKLLQESGEIRELRHHTRWPLIVNGSQVCVYESDFDYQTYSRGAATGDKIPNSWHDIVEDVKSPATRKLPLYRLKAKLMKAIHGIEIREV